MSPRLPASLTSAFTSLRINPRIRTFVTTPKPLSNLRLKRKTYNPHAEARSKKIREANLARQSELRTERAERAVDPVLGHTTPFTTTLDEVPEPLPSLDAIRSGSNLALPPEEQRLNHFLTPQELPAALERSSTLLAPRPSPDDSYLDPDLAAASQERHDQAVEAVRRIVALGNGSSADRSRSNKQMCIEVFGRHNTDSQLPADPGAHAPAATGKTPRAGPDTGSSEVQAAILTVKIRVLAKELQQSGNKDKHNKRNLRLMVHRRQKLLKYLKRKEKGGVRYRNVMEALGLDDAAIEKELFL